ncbi:hypothetical protein ACFLZP_00245 [Patescibacteria group bacterium]
MRNPIRLAQVLGNVQNPWDQLNPNYPAEGGKGLIILFTNLVRLIIVVAGIYTFLNMIMAGYEFLSTEGNPEKIVKAWNKIWHSMVGLLIVAGSFALAALLGFLIFNNVTAILSPVIYGP